MEIIKWKKLGRVLAMVQENQFPNFLNKPNRLNF